MLGTGWQASRRAEEALRAAAVNHLTSIRAERGRQIEEYFAAVRRDAAALSGSREVVLAMREFRTAYADVDARVARWPDGVRTRSRAQVAGFYDVSFVPRLRALQSETETEVASPYVPASDVAIALQALFIADPPAADGSRDELDRPAGGGHYGDVHAALHPRLRSLTRQFGYDDLFLIDEAGRIVYTVAKKVDFATDLLSGPHRRTRLSRAFRQARAAVDGTRVALVDFESYAPALGAPAAFVAAPVFENGRRLGVVALEIPLDRVDAVMTGERRWQGLGRTGETYLVGPDRRMRSDSRFFLEQPDDYLETIARTGVPEDVLGLMRTHRRTVLFQQITSAAGHAALGGATGTTTERDYRGEPVLTSYAPLAIAGLSWGIVAKVDAAEAFAPAGALRRAVLAIGAAIAALVAVTAVLLARSLTAPIRRLIGAMGMLGRGQLDFRIAEVRGDEIGQIATAFNRMAADLQATTISRDHVRGILDAMTDAVMVVRPPQGVPDWRNGTVVSVNPAACAMLARPADQIVGQRIGDAISAITAGAAPGQPATGEWLENVLRDGRIGAREAVYTVSDGRHIPVLFSSAVVGEGANPEPQLVCAAHDLTELKSIEARNAFIRETFGRYVSDEVVTTLLGTPDALKLGGELRRVTVVMSDLRGFTLLAERLAPERAIEFLNGYLQTMVDLILQHRGTIIEIMGDGILVIFGAPTARADDAERAVRCAVAMQRAMTEVNAWTREHALPEIEMGIGIHTGEVIVGNIGSERRTKYAAVGSTVNLAGRIEACTAGGQILVSDSTRREAGPAVRVSRALRIEPKGAREPLTVWDVTGVEGAELIRRDDALAPVDGDVPVRYAIVENKLVGSEVFDGTLVRLSSRGAEIRSSRPVAPLTDLKLWIEPDGETAEIYGKVIEPAAAATPGFVVRFTSTAPPLGRYLSRPPD